MAQIPRIALVEPGSLPPQPFEPYPIRLRGGLDMVSPPFERYRNPGAAIHLVNYIVTEEGYELVPGYKKFRTQAVPGVGPIYAVAQHEGQTSGVYAFRRKADGKLGVYRAATNETGAWIEMAADATTLPDGIEPPPPGNTVRWRSHAFAANSAPVLYFVTGAQPKGLYTVAPNDVGIEVVTGVDVGLESDADRPDAERFPRFIEAHQDHLMLGFEGGAVIWSALGKPLDFSAIIGAGEANFKNIGSKLTGLLSGFQRRLWITGADGVYFLEGTSVRDFNVRPLSSEMGSTVDTLQLGDRPLYFSNEGVREVGLGGEGGFTTGTLSREMVPYIENLIEGAHRTTASLLLRDRGQYRVFFDNGAAIVACLVQRRGQERSWEFATLRYPKSVTAASNVPAPTDARGVYFADRALVAFGRETQDEDISARTSVAGDEPDGIVYLDGTPPQGGPAPADFDGTAIHGAIHLGFNKMRHPTVIKKFNRTVVEGSAREAFEMGLVFLPGAEPESLSLAESVQEVFTVPPRDGGWADRANQPVSRWDEMRWDEGQWWGTSAQDEEDLAREEVVRTPGRGLGFAMVLYTDYDENTPAPPPHVLTGINVLWKGIRHVR